jgi:DNA end-binding protein Ku
VAPRAYWKGYLKLSLVSCPITLFPATSEREKVSFHQVNKKTGHRIKYKKVDAQTGDEVESADIIKGYEVGKGQYIEIEPEELEAIAIESKRTIEIDEFVPKQQIDELYLNSPYYIRPDGKVGEQAFAVIREAINKKGMVAIGKVVFTSREHMIALEPRGKGLMGITLRYPYEIRDEKDYFGDIPDEKIPKDMLDLAAHIVDTKTGDFEPSKFEDQYEDAVRELLTRKQQGDKIEAPTEREPAKVVNLMDALRRSVEAERGGKKEPAASVQQRSAKKKPGRSSAPHKRAG